MYGRELLGSGAYWHELPGERDRPKFYGTTTLSGTDGQQPYVLPRQLIVSGGVSGAGGVGVPRSC